MWELLGDVYSDFYGLNIVTPRPVEVYGRGRRMPQSVAELIRMCLDGRPDQLRRGADERFHCVRVVAWLRDHDF